MSLKTFKRTDTDYVRVTAETPFRPWGPLIRHADQVSVLLWTADDSEILDYRGELDEPLECSFVVQRVGDESVVFALNRGGQLMAWNADGPTGGEGQDGTVAQVRSLSPCWTAQSKLPKIRAPSRTSLRKRKPNPASRN